MLSSSLWAICICIMLTCDIGVSNAEEASDYEYYDEETITSKNDVPAPDQLMSKMPAYFERNELELNAQTGTNVMLNCDVRNYQINNVVVWYNNTIIMSNGKYAINERVESLKNNSLRIKNVQPWDTGSYYCVVLPEKIKLHIHLKVDAPFGIFTNNQDVTGLTLTLRQGNSLSLECRAASTDELPPTYKWSLNGRRAELLVSNIDDGRLTVNSIDAEHAGIYQCLADEGSKYPPHGLVNIEVQYAPKVSTHRHHANTAAGADTELYCDYNANPIAVVHWLRKGRVLGYSEKHFISNMPHNNRNRSILLIKDVDADDLGEYVCQVQNVIGSGEIHVVVGYEPEIPQFEDMKIQGNRVILHWLVRSIQPLSEAVLDYKLTDSYTWSTVSVIHTHRHAQSANMWKVSHEIELLPGEWHTRVRTRNTAGWSHFSQPHDFVLKSSSDEVLDDGALPPDDLVVSAGVFKSANSSSISFHAKTEKTWLNFALFGIFTVFLCNLSQ